MLKSNQDTSDKLKTTIEEEVQKVTEKIEQIKNKGQNNFDAFDKTITERLHQMQKGLNSQKAHIGKLDKQCDMLAKDILGLKSYNVEMDNRLQYEKKEVEGMI